METTNVAIHVKVVGPCVGKTKQLFFEFARPYIAPGHHYKSFVDPYYTPKWIPKLDRKKRAIWDEFVVVVSKIWKTISDKLVTHIQIPRRLFVTRTWFMRQFFPLAPPTKDLDTNNWEARADTKHDVKHELLGLLRPGKLCRGNKIDLSAMQSFFHVALSFFINAFRAFFNPLDRPTIRQVDVWRSTSTFMQIALTLCNKFKNESW